MGTTTSKDPSYDVPADQFYAQLHPELRGRLQAIMQDLRARGWNPSIPTRGGPQGTGYRSQAEQTALRKAHPGATAVNFSYHNATDASGAPQSMAVHITERSIGANPPKGHPFVEDLEAIAKRHGLATGNDWTKPWDPLHVQLYEKSEGSPKTMVARSPAVAGWKPGLLPPSLNPNTPRFLQPSSIGQLMAGQRFTLAQNFGLGPNAGINRFTAPPPPGRSSTTAPITRSQFESGQRMRLEPVGLGQSRPGRAPWASDPTREPFRRADASFGHPSLLGGARLREPAIPGRSFVNTAALGSLRLPEPRLGASLGLGRPAPSLGIASRDVVYES